MTKLAFYLRDNPVKVRRLRVATGGRCENCSNGFPLSVLEIHIIGSPSQTIAHRDLQKHLLVLCPACRRPFSSGEVAEPLQRELVRHRPRDVRKMMREILGYRPRKYVPPGDFRPDEIFDEMITTGALDQCLNGG